MVKLFNIFLTNAKDEIRSCKIYIRYEGSTKMGKKSRRKKKPREKKNESTSISTNTHGAENEKEVIKAAIIEALKEIESQKENDRIENAKDRKKTHFLSAFIMILKAPFARKDNISGEITTAFMGSLLSTVFFIAECGSLLMTLGFIRVIVVDIIEKGFLLSRVLFYLLGILITFLFYVLSGVFRSIGVEMERIEDREYMSSLFAAICAIISVVIAIIGLVK